MSFFLPILLLGDMVYRRRWKTLITAVIAAAAAAGISALVVWMGATWWPKSDLFGLLPETLHRHSIVAALPYVSVIAALLTMSNSSKDSRITRGGWWLFGVVLMLSILQGHPRTFRCAIYHSRGRLFWPAHPLHRGRLPDHTTGTKFVELIHKGGYRRRDGGAYRRTHRR